VGEAAACRGEEIAPYLARPDREKLAAETPGQDAECDIDDAVDHEQPHGREVPQQRTGKPIAERDLVRKSKTEQRRGIVNLPA